MSKEKGIETRVELDYGIQYMTKVFNDMSREISMAYTRAQETRMSIGRYLNYLGSPNPYPQMNNPDSNVIELSVDKSHEEPDINEEHDSVTHTKYIIGGFSLGLENLSKIRTSPLPPGLSPTNMTLAIRSLDRAIDSLELSICWLNRELKRIRHENPDLYPIEQIVFGVDIEKVPDDVVSTDEIMENRAKEIKDEKEETK